MNDAASGTAVATAVDLPPTEAGPRGPRSRRLRICFFARVHDPAVLQRVEFYAQDLAILASLGHEVRVVTRVRDLRPADLYVIWWWTWAFAPVTLARLLGRPSLVTGTLDLNEFRGRPWWQRSLIRLGLRGASANVFVSHLERTEVPALMAVNRPRFSPHTVDPSIYCPAARVAEDTDPLIFTVAWLQGLNATRKCVAELIRAVPEICRVQPDVRFVIAGERGSAYPELAALAASLGVADRVEFLGTIDRERKIELMRRCRIYLQPTRFEGFGLAILEAMSCGAAIVTSPVGAVPEVVGPAARLVDGTDPSAIAAAVLDLLADASARADLGRQARQRAETMFPHERRRRELREVIDELTGV